jgi:hypothetical protein
MARFRAVTLAAVVYALAAASAGAQAPPPTPAADPIITAPVGSPLKAGALAVADDFPTPRTFPTMPLHDPYILADETTRTYYLYTQNVASLSGSAGGGTMVYRSKNLVNWSDPTKVYAIETDGWARPQNGAWAPEVHAYNGRYYLFTTLHNSQQVIATASTQGQACGNCGQIWQNQTYRATVIAVADSPMGPFTQLDKAKPVTPRNFMTLDGTLFMEDGKPWMVYAHEWIQKIDGTMEAIPLTDDLTAAAGAPIYLFKASDAPWYDTESTPNTDQMPPYVTDGPQFYRSRNGDLIMLWTSYRNHNLEYVETWARSKSGKLAGPWEQMPPLITGNKGHAMIFWTFEGAPMLVLHNNMNQPNVRGEVYDVKFTGDGVKILRHREDIDGVPGVPPFPGESETQTTEDTGVGGSVPATLSLALGAPPTLGPFVPGTAKDYTGTVTATTTSSAGTATLAVTDPGASPGHLVNGTFSLPQPLQVRATNATTQGAFAPLTTAVPLVTYLAPTSNDAVTVEFKQAIGASDPLRTGTYAKTLTLTLSTDEP